MKQNVSVFSRGNLFRLLIIIAVLAAIVIIGGPVQQAQAAGTVSSCTWAGGGGLQAALSGGGTVTFNCDGVIVVPQIQITQDTVLDGNGRQVTLSGNNANRVINVNPNIRLTVKDLTIADGNAFGRGGGINVVGGGSLTLTNSVVERNHSNGGRGDGGGISFQDGGALSIINSTIRNNVANGYVGGGGLLYYDINGAGTPVAPVTISGSTFSGNSTTETFASGGGIQFASDTSGATTANINNSTFSGNSTLAKGGGIDIAGSAQNAAITLNIDSSTFTGNTATSPSSQHGPDIGVAEGDDSSVTVNLKNSIFASGCGNYFSPNFAYSSLGHNLAIDNTCNLTQPTDLPNTNPQLGLLANNGGPTWTHLPISGSPAIDAGDTTLANDQRSVARPQGPADDIGAVEAGVPTPTPLRFTIEDPGVQLSQIDQNSCPNLQTAYFDATPTGSYSTLGTNDVFGVWQGPDGKPKFVIQDQDQFGGADQPFTPTHYIKTAMSGEYTLTLSTVDFPDGAGYFGFWWSAGLGANTIEVTRADGTVETFTTQSILDSPALQGPPGGHYGNPTAAFLGQNPNEPYAFVNIYAQDDASRIKSIRFIETTGQGYFESDNHTACAELIDPGDQSGTALGSIIIVKETNPDNLGNYNFTDNIAAPNAFSLDDDGQKIFENVSSGTYEVTEGPSDPSLLAKIVCEDGDQSGTASTTDLDARTATIHLDPNETVTCTFTNENPRDYGDAPDSYGTTIAANGPSHFFSLNTLILGSAFDFEADGLPSANADGDDNDNTDDEDALSTPLPPLHAGDTSYTLQNIPVTNLVPTDATLYGWIDFNGSGTFEAGEKASVAVPGGGATTVDLTWNSLSGLVPGDTYLRLRLSDQNTLGPTGPGGSGEVEDYPLTIDASGTIIIHKQTAPDGLSNFDFSGDLGAFTLNDGEQKTVANLAPGTYKVTEDDPGTGTFLSGLTCDDSQSPTPSTVDQANREATIELDPGETVNCTFTNTAEDLIVVFKQTFPSGGTGFDFSGDLGNFTLDDSDFQYFFFNPGQDITITEDDPAPAYDLADIECIVVDQNTLDVVPGDVQNRSVTLNLDAGQAAFCGFVNNQRSTLVIEKQTQPDGDPQLFDFTLTGDNAQNIADVADGEKRTVTNLVPGIYTLEEVVPSAWVLSDIKCDSRSGLSDYLPDLEQDGTLLELAPGDTMSCIFTNSKAGHITIIKETEPAGGQGFGFSFSASGGSNGSTTLADGDRFTLTVPPGENITVIEDDPSASGYTLTDIECKVSQGDTSITIDRDNRQVDFALSPDQSAECTFTNSQVGTIIIEKETHPDLPDIFTYDQTIDNSGPFTLSNGQSQEFHNVAPGQYAVFEQEPPPGVFLGGVQCDDDSSATPSIDGLGVAQPTINLDPGEVVTCTFSNFTDASVVIQKFTRPAGDNQTAFGFQSDLPGGDYFELKDGEVKTFKGVLPGETYTVAEEPPGLLGYTLGDIQCLDTATGQVIQGDMGDNSVSFTPAPGQSIYCAFTNIKNGEVIITKATQPPGSLEEFDFVSNITANTSFPLVDGQSRKIPVFGGRQYTVEELANTAGFQLADIRCTDSVKGGKPSSGNPAAGKATINVDPGETVECIFTNAQDDLILVQKLTDPAGGTNFDFTSTFNAPDDSFTLNDTQVQAIENVTPGQAYTITETDPTPGFDLTDLGCYDVTTQTTIPGDLDARSVSFTPQAGDLVYCAFLNTQRGSVTIVKETKPASGDSFDFTLTGGGASTPQSVTAGSQETIDNLIPGVYTLVEADPTAAGYLLENIECVDSDSGGQKSTADKDTRTATIRLDPGENVTCTYTNSKEAKITITKVTEPAGGVGFSFNNGAYTLDGGDSFSVDVSGPFTITEDDPAPHNYALTDISCSGNSGYTIDQDQRKVDFDAAPGQDIECVFTNTLLGKVIIEKTTHPDLPDNFGFDQDIDVSGSFILSNGLNKTFANVVPGSYQVSEGAPGGDIQLAGILCDDKNSKHQSVGDIASRTAYINVEPGEVVTCTFTNVENDTVVIQKFTDPAGDLNTEFGFTSNLPGAAAFNLKDSQFEIISGVTPGQPYTLSEADPSPLGYDLADIVCFDTNTDQSIPADLQNREVTFTPEAGHSVYCAFINEKAGKIVINKAVNPAGETFDFTSNAGLPTFTLGDGDSQEILNVQPGSYRVTEELGNPDYLLAGVTCQDSDLGGTASLGDQANRQAIINLDPGETVTCDFINSEKDVVLVQKLTIPSGGPDFNFSSTFDAPDDSFALGAGDLQVIEDVVPNQSYTITELDPGPDYDLAAVACFDTFSGQEIDGDPATGQVTFTPIPGHVIYCGFVNVERGSVTIVKETDPASNDSFDFLLTGNGTSTPQSVSAGSPETIEQLLPGVYQLLESDPSADGYALTGIECVDSETGGTKSTVDKDSRTAFVRLDPGENVTCTFRNEQVRIELVESYAVSSVTESWQGGPGTMACYWVISNLPVSGSVVVEMTPQKGEVRLDKSAVTLTASNWNSLSLTERSNMVCIRGNDDQIDDGGARVCKDGRPDLFGMDPTIISDKECGDHIDYVDNRITSSTDPKFGPGTPFTSNSPEDLDGDKHTVDTLVRDNDRAGVILTESYAVTDLDEDGTPVNLACYWVTLNSQPRSAVTVNISGDSEVKVDKSSVLLKPSNWNKIDETMQDRFNMVCASPVNENVADASDPHCFTGSADLLGAAGSGSEVCGDHLGHISHSTSSGDGRYNNNQNFSGNGPNFDSDRSTVDALIRNDDVIGVTFTPTTLNVLEGGEVSYAVTLKSQPAANVTVSRDGRSRTFTPNNWDEAQTLTFAAPEDNLREGPEAVQLAHTVSSTDAGYDAFKADPVSVLIVDNDTPGVLLSSTIVDVAEGGKTSSYKVSLTAPPSAAVTVSLDGGSQLRVEPASLSFSRSNWDEPQRVTVSAVNDRVVEEAQHSGRIRHSVSSSDAEYDGLTVVDLVGSIADNDSAGVKISRRSLSVSEGGSSAGYTVVLESRPTRPVMVTVDGGAQLVAEPATLTFNGSNWNQAQRVTVHAVDDRVAEGGAQAVLNHLVSSEDSFYNGLPVDSMRVEVGDNDRADVLLSHTVLPVPEGGANSYTVRLGSKPLAPVVIDLSSSQGISVATESCADEEGACLTFTTENWNREQRVTVKGEVAGAIEHTVSSGDSQYNGLALPEVQIMPGGSLQIFMPIIRK